MLAILLRYRLGKQLALLRKLTIVMLALLAIVTAITLLLGGFMPLFSVASGLLFLYYLALYFGMKFVGDGAKKPFIYSFALLFIVPIILTLVDPEAVLGFLLQGIDIDMK